MRNSRIFRASFLFFLRGKCSKSTRDASIIELSRRVYCIILVKGQPFIDKVKGNGIEQDCPKVAEEVYKFFYLLEYNHILTK